jgi:hypothetical protein
MTVWLSFSRFKNASLSALNVNTSYPDASTAAVLAVFGCFRKLAFIFQKKTQFLTIFTTFRINYYDNVGLMRPLMIGINLVGKDTLNSPHFKTIDDAKNQRYL